ncbi:MAG: hypothetical protein FLDDKLPJ_02703 [Phycisphaerae bacterium]|nr:hypothetical protein [Phycisphaerae bacterium]
MRSVVMSAGARAARAWVFVLGSLIAAPQVRAGEGVFLDVTSLLFNYDAINPNAGEGELVGRIVILPGEVSHLSLQQLDLGADGGFGGGDDVILDVAEIGNAANFDVLLALDVIRGGGPNQYRLRGDFAATDTVTTLADPSILGALDTTEVSLIGPIFQFDGSLATQAFRDSLLGPEGGSDWIFQGVPADTGPAPDGDGSRGRVTLLSDREVFDFGALGEFHFAGFGFNDLDAFFAADRNALSADVKLAIVPEPATLAFLLAGLFGLRRLRNR